MSKRVFILGLDGATPALFERYLTKGKMPHLEKFMKEGAYSEAISFPYGATPINWATIATGTYPGTHGIPTFCVHKEGTPMDETYDGFVSEACTTEYIWEAASRKGIGSAVISYPGNWPVRCEKQITIGSRGFPGQGSRLTFSPPMCLGSGDAETSFTLSLKWEKVNIDIDETSKVIYLTSFNFPSAKKEWNAKESYLGIVSGNESEKSLFIALFADKACSREICRFYPAKWSEWFSLEISSYSGEKDTVRGRGMLNILKISSDSPVVRLYFTETIPDSLVAIPSSIGKELLEHIGPYQDYCGKTPLEKGWLTPEQWLEESLYKGKWMVNAVKYLMEKNYISLALIKLHMFDHLCHERMGKIDPFSPFFDPDTKDYWENVFEIAHTYADDIIGMTADFMDKDDILVIVSDHGELVYKRVVSINNILWNAGMLKAEVNEGKVVIDWRNTKAFAHGGSQTQIRLNVKGRDPDGCVEPDDYENVQREVIKILRDFCDPETGAPVFSMAIPKQEAGLFGLWGNRCGDILYYCNPGYVAEWWDITPDRETIRTPSAFQKPGNGYFASMYQSVHGASLPTLRYGIGGEAAIFFARGKGIKRNFQRKKPIKLTDIVPLVSYLSDIPPTKDCEGAIPFDMVE